MCDVLFNSKDKRHCLTAEYAEYAEETRRESYQSSVFSSQTVGDVPLIVETHILVTSIPYISISHSIEHPLLPPTEWTPQGVRIPPG